MPRLPMTQTVEPSPPRAALPAPDWSPHHLVRPRLLDLLDNATQGPLTVVVAPAGWGKTILLGSWARARVPAGRVLWLTGDGRDSDEFWLRLLDALTATGSGAAGGSGTASEESATDEGTAATGAERFMAALAAVPERVTLILDDCPDVADPAALAGVERLLSLVEGRLRLVLACRTEPALPLHRWRVSGGLAELRADQLAFSVTETGDLLREYGVTLPEASVVNLHAMTQGWPAGLRLAALAMGGHPEPDQVVADLGSHDLVADYLAAEVLAVLPADLRERLVAMSVAEHLNPGLVEALTTRSDGAEVLAELHRRGAFIQRCPGLGEWYRVHPLFSRVLYAELRRQGRDGLLAAHRRAAAWYVTHGPATEALRHLLAAEDWPRAVEILRRHWPDIAVVTRRQSLREIVVSRPDSVHVDPWLAMAFAAERLGAGDRVGLRRFLRIAEAATDTESRPSPTMMAAFRLAEARLNGDDQHVFTVASELQAAPENASDANVEHGRTLGLISLGASYLHQNDLREAGWRLRDGLGVALRTDLAHAQVVAGCHLAVWLADLGRLRAAVHTARDALSLADRLGLMRMTELGWGRLALAEAYYQWDRLDEAWRLTEEALDDAYADRLMLISGTIMQAKVRLAAGQLSDAHEALLTARQEAGNARVAGPVNRTLSLVEAELRLACGDLATARRQLASWPDAEDEPFPAWAATVEASILLAEGRAAAAAAAVAPHLAEAGASLTWRVRAGVLTALASQALGDRERVTRGLDVALEAAEEEGFRRTFSAGGHAVRELITTVAPAMTVYRPVVSRLAEAPDPLATPIRPAGAAPGTSAATIGGGGFLGGTSTRGLPARQAETVEPLTERELTVLRYLQGTLSNVEIASLLYVSVNTVKTHVKNIYRKLDAGHRREAVRRARDLRLL